MSLLQFLDAPLGREVTRVVWLSQRGSSLTPIESWYMSNAGRKRALKFGLMVVGLCKVWGEFFGGLGLGRNN